MQATPTDNSLSSPAPACASRLLESEVAREALRSERDEDGAGLLAVMDARAQGNVSFNFVRVSIGEVTVSYKGGSSTPAAPAAPPGATSGSSGGGILDFDDCTFHMDPLQYHAKVWSYSKLMNHIKNGHASAG